MLDMRRQIVRTQKSFLCVVARAAAAFDVLCGLLLPVLLDFETSLPALLPALLSRETRCRPCC